MSKKTANPPEFCDICGDEFTNCFPDEVPTCYDGRTEDGPWAWMCVSCFAFKGVGLGTGKGQKYVYNEEDKAWYKEEG